MKLNLSYLEGVWLPFKNSDDVKVKIKMLPLSKSLDVEQGGDSIETMYSVYDECLLDWTGFVDEDDNIIECTPENKRRVFDAYTELFEFVMTEQNILRQKFSVSLKNLKTSVPTVSKKARKTPTK